MSGILDRLFQKRVLRRWRRAARAASDTPLPVLREQRGYARQLRAQISQLIHVADGRLALPHVGSTSFPRPHGTDWSWRPDLWRGPLGKAGVAAMPSKTALGDEVTLFHDCPLSELSLRQVRNTREGDLAPFGLRIDVFHFGGTFLSLVIDMPPALAKGLTKSHLVRMDAIIETENPIDIFARLNIRHGPNTEQLVRELPKQDKSVMVEFDLAYGKINENRIEKIWLDLILDEPAMNQIVLKDLTFARYRRAAI